MQRYIYPHAFARPAIGKAFRNISINLQQHLQNVELGNFINAGLDLDESKLLL